MQQEIETSNSVYYIVEHIDKLMSHYYASDRCLFLRRLSKRPSEYGSRFISLLWFWLKNQENHGFPVYCGKVERASATCLQNRVPRAQVLLPLPSKIPAKPLKARLSGYREVYLSKRRHSPPQGLCRLFLFAGEFLLCLRIKWISPTKLNTTEI